MTVIAAQTSKLEFSGGRSLVPTGEAIALVASILEKSGCTAARADIVARHLVDADLCGVESHGVMRVLQYVEQFESGYLKPDASPVLVTTVKGLNEVDGRGGIGMPAMILAVDVICTQAKSAGLAVLPVRNVGHTGRLGAYAETAANAGCLLIIVGGGGRHNWRQVAPYGGRKALLPTNPYCLGIPGGNRGPVVIDFATSMIAGGWLHSARAAGALVPEGSIVDAKGHPSRDPSAYFDGGAILPKGGPMGYGMAVMAEMICDAMLGPASTECNWLLIGIDTTRYRGGDAMCHAAEEILSELRDCPPSPGFDRVLIPGERERDLRAQNTPRGVALPARTLGQIQDLGRRLGVVN